MMVLHAEILPPRPRGRCHKLASSGGQFPVRQKSRDPILTARLLLRQQALNVSTKTSSSRDFIDHGVGLLRGSIHESMTVGQQNDDRHTRAAIASALQRLRRLRYRPR